VSRGLPFLSARRPLTPETQAWVAAVNAAGSGVSGSTQRAVDRYVRDLIANRLWDKIYMLDCCAGNNLTASLVRLKVPAGVARAYTNNNFVAADFTETGANGGRKGDGTTKYLDTGINEKALGFGLSDTMRFCYRRETNAAGTTRLDIGSAGAGFNNYSGWLLSGSTEAVYMATVIAAGVGGATSLSGLLGGGCSGSRTQQFYHNGLPIGTPNAATGDFPNINLFAHANNNGGNPNARSTARTSQFLVTMGFSASEVLKLYNIVQAFETAMGRAV
jgi:hypothetical protein